MAESFTSKIDRGSIESTRASWGEEIYARVKVCPRESEHRYGPGGYLAWHAWADERRKTHRQIKCECGLYLLHEPKPAPKPRKKVASA